MLTWEQLHKLTFEIVNSSTLLLPAWTQKATLKRLELSEHLFPKDVMTQWNLTFEQEVFRDSKLELAYVGNRGIHLLNYTDANPVPLAGRRR